MTDTLAVAETNLSLQFGAAKPLFKNSRLKCGNMACGWHCRLTTWSLYEGRFKPSGSSERAQRRL